MERYQDIQFSRDQELPAEVGLVNFGLQIDDPPQWEVMELSFRLDYDPDFFIKSILLSFKVQVSFFISGFV